MFLEWFGTGRGVVWREEMMESFLIGCVGSVGVGIRKINLEWRTMGGVGGGVGGDRFWWRGGETVESFELAKLYQL